jgi:hypothetical protein
MAMAMGMARGHTNVLFVVRVVLVQQLQDLDLLAGLSRKMRVVLDDLDRDVPALERVVRVHHLPERPLHRRQPRVIFDRWRPSHPLPQDTHGGQLSYVPCQ